MSKLMIKNGKIFDPINKIEGEKKDLLIEEGKFVEKFSNSNDIKEIDANGKTVIPSAIEIHSHIASSQINWIRLLGKKVPEFQSYWKNLTLPKIARSYISHGYTFILEANVVPSFAKQTIFDLNRLPVLDKAYLLNLSNIWALELEYQKGIIEDGALFISDILNKVKGFGIKAYNPFEAENWNWQILRENLEEKGRLYNFIPMDIYENLTKMNEYLGLPHSLHAHIEGYEALEAKKNVNDVLSKIKSFGITPNSKSGRTQIFHLAHGSSYNIDGNNDQLIDFYNNNKEFDLDLAFMGFNEINPLITSDRRLVNNLTDSGHPYQLIRTSLESEGDAYFSLRKFNKKTERDCILWANAFELALEIANKWQLQFSLNYPNYGDVEDIPRLVELLLNAKEREKYMNGMNSDFLENNRLVSNPKELNFNDIVIITRSSPAVSLGMGKIKGNLGIGADGDVNILNVDLNKLDTVKDSNLIRKAFENIEIVVKNGDLVKKRNELNLNHYGKLFWSDGSVESSRKDSILKKKTEYYQKYYSMFYNSLKITNLNKKSLVKI